MYTEHLIAVRVQFGKIRNLQNSLSPCTITQFSHCIRLKNAYFSPPFYTSACGYKMCLKVYAAGDVGTHVAIHGFLMKGEYDDSLLWPFCADIVIDILNWRDDHSHHREILHFNNDSFVCL